MGFELFSCLVLNFNKNTTHEEKKIISLTALWMSYINAYFINAISIKVLSDSIAIKISS